MYIKKEYNQVKELLDKPILWKDPNYKKKVLLFDIENSPLVSYTWGIFEQNVVEVKEEWYILCFAYKWLGEKETHFVSLPDFKEYKKNKKDDSALVKKLHELFNQAEIIIAHNGDAFDIKKANSRFIQHRLEPPTFYKTIDTLKIARKNFKFDSNKLDRLGQYLEVGRKEKHMDFSIWLGCMEGDSKSWAKMKIYNKQDVVLLEKIYYKLRGWDTSLSPNMNLILGSYHNCPKCGSEHIVKNGFRPTTVCLYQAYQCMNCGKKFQGEKVERGKQIFR